LRGCQKALGAEKRFKADGKAAKKEAQAKLKEEWKKIKIVHKEAVKVWRCLHPRMFQRRIGPRGWSTNESQSSQSLWK